MNLPLTPSKNYRLAPLKWEKARSGVSDSVVATSTASVSQFVICNSSFLIDFGYAYQGHEIERSEIRRTPIKFKKEMRQKDKETGKEAFELRLWVSRIGRWLTTDPSTVKLS